jgi:hypothetical protein
MNKAYQGQGWKDECGHKHVLGLREGATENVRAARALLAELIERGLDTERSLLVVIDGATAQGGDRGLRPPRTDSALPRAQETQCHRRPAAARRWPQRDGSGLCYA